MTTSSSTKYEIDPALYPDFHHKMSKKIAQLTKVIYSLNTANEDSRYVLEESVERGRWEVEEVMCDAKVKMDGLRGKVWEKNEEVVFVSKELEGFKMKYHDEKKAAVGKIKELVEQFKSKEGRANDEMGVKLTAINNEVVGLKTKLSMSLKNFENSTQTLKDAYDSKTSAATSRFDELKKKHESEIEVNVVEANKRYQDMLISQMNTLEETCMKLENEHDSALKGLSREHEKSLIALKNELEQSYKDKIDGEINKHNKELLNEQTANTTQLNTLQKTITELTNSNTSLTQNLTTSTSLNAKQTVEINKLKVEIDNLRSTIKGNNVKGSEEVELLKTLNSELTSDCERKDKTIVDLGDEIKSLGMVNDKLKGEVGDCYKRIEKFKIEGDGNGVRIKALENEVIFSNEENVELNNGMTTLKQTHATIIDNNTQEKNKLIAEIASLNSRLQEMKTSNDGGQSSLRDEITKLNTKYDNMMTEHANQVKTLEDGMAQRVAQLDSDHKQMVESINVKHGDAISLKNGELLELNKTTTLAINAAALQTEQAVKVGEENTHAAVTSASEKLDLALEKWNSERAQLNDKITKLMEAGSNESENSVKLNLEVVKLKGDVKSLTKELNDSRDNNAKSSTAIAGLKKQIEQLNLDIERLKSKGSDDLKDEIAKLKSSHEIVINELADKNMEELHDQELKYLEKLQKVNKDHKGNLERLNVEMEGLLKDEIDKNTLSQAESAKSLSDEVDAHAQTRSSLEARVDKLLKGNEESNSELMAKHANELTELEYKLVSERERLMKDITAKHDDAIKKLEKQHKSILTNAKDDADKFLENTKREIKNEEMVKQREAEKRINDANDVKVKNTKEYHEKQVKLLTTEHSKLLDSKALEIDDINTRLTNESNAKNGLSERLTLVSNELDAKSLEMTQTIGRINATHVADTERLENERVLSLSKLKRDHEQTVNELTAENNEKVKALNVDINDREAEITRLEQQYLNRSSLQSDIDKINTLEIEMVQKDELVAKTKEEMIYFKRELLNREENFNSKFNASPNVGVMSVIKSNNGKGGNGGGNGGGGNNNGGGGGNGNGKKGGNKQRRNSANGGLPPPAPGPQFGL